jgi:molybdopterin/thiamine biosynthesis adenylyltransferase
LNDPLWVIDATLKAKGFSLSRPPSTYRGPIFPHGNKATVEIKIVDPMFATLPEIRLIDGTQLPVTALAHLNVDDTICYVGQGGLPLDLYNPGGSVLRALLEAQSTLERSFGGGATAEYETELASYWQGQIVYVALPMRQATQVGRADLLNIGTSDRARFAVVPTDRWKHMRPRSREPVTILSFATKLQHTAAFGSKTLAGILSWLEDQRELVKNIRRAIISSAAADELVFIVSPNALIGWRPMLPVGLKALQKGGGVRKVFLESQIAKSLDQIGLEHMTGLQFDLRSVVERNLFGKPSLIGKRIALVGCGTIGGNLAKLLVQSGAGCGEAFTIYDTDILRPGNLGRHVLDFIDLNRPKVSAMADLLRKFHPDVQINSRQCDALEDWDSLERMDLIMDATGDYNVATALNHKRMNSAKDGNELAILHAWVFGNGIAAQTFLNLKDNLACYRCLKPRFDGPWRYPPVKDVTKSIELAPAICGEAGYVPFAADAPVTAASLALRAVLDWAAKHPGQRLRTVTLNHEDGKDVKWVSPSRSTDCPVCGG